MSIIRYLVALNTPAGRFVLNVPSISGPEAAGERAFWSAMTQRWGEVDEVTVVSIKPVVSAVSA